MEDWDSLEKVFRRRLSGKCQILKSGLIRDVGFEEFEWRRTLLWRSKDYYGIAEKEDGTEEWYVHKLLDLKINNKYEDVQFYKNWKEFHSAFSKDQIETLRTLGVSELLDENKEVLDTIKETDLVNTLHDKTELDCHTKSMFAALWTRIIKLEKMMTEIYNAPGMPGRVAAQKSFENQQNQKL